MAQRSTEKRRFKEVFFCQTHINGDCLKAFVNYIQTGIKLAVFGYFTNYTHSSLILIIQYTITIFRESTSFMNDSIIVYKNRQSKRKCFFRALTTPENL